MNKYKIKYPYFSKDKLNEIEQKYIHYHTPRYDYIVKKLKKIENELKKSSIEQIKLLDVGPHFLTEIVRQDFKFIVNTLGYKFDSATKERDSEQHITFDLNNASDESKWVKLPKHNIILAAEIIEHVYTSPNYIIPFLKSGLLPGGYIIIQTPNAVAIKHRLLMLAGRNPFELIRETLNNPGHFREYTKKEMISYFEKHGFELFDFGCYSYYNYVRHKYIGFIYRNISRILPPSLRDNMTLIFRLKS